VREDGDLPTEGPVQQDVERGRDDPLLGPHDVGHAHEVVVDDVGQVVGRIAVALEQHRVADLGVGHGDLAAQEVVEGGAAAVRRPQTHHVRLARRSSPALFARRDVAPAAVVARVDAPLPLVGAQTVELLRGLERAVGVAALDQRLDVRRGRGRGARSGGRVRGSPPRPGPSSGTGPATQDAHDASLDLGQVARAIGVLDAQDEAAAMAPREGVVEQGDVGRADVRVAGGRWGDAGDDGHGAPPTVVHGTAGGSAEGEPSERGAGNHPQVGGEDAEAATAEQGEEHEQCGVADDGRGDRHAEQGAPVEVGARAPRRR
jgi:hypothetical protein